MKSWPGRSGRPQRVCRRARTSPPAAPGQVERRAEWKHPTPAEVEGRAFPGGQCATAAERQQRVTEPIQLPPRLRREDAPHEEPSFTSTTLRSPARRRLNGKGSLSNGAAPVNEKKSD